MLFLFQIDTIINKFILGKKDFTIFLKLSGMPLSPAKKAFLKAFGLYFKIIFSWKKSKKAFDLLNLEV